MSDTPTPKPGILDIAPYVGGASKVAGQDRVITLFADLADQVDDMRLSLKDVYESRDGAVLRFHLWARRASQVLDVDYLQRLEIRDRVITACDVIAVDQIAADAFFSWLH